MSLNPNWVAVSVPVGEAYTLAGTYAAATVRGSGADWSYKVVIQGSRDTPIVIGWDNKVFGVATSSLMALTLAQTVVGLADTYWPTYQAAILTAFQTLLAPPPPPPPI